LILKPKDPNTDLTYSYLSLRNAIGWIGILLPFVLMGGMFLIFNGKVIQKTISQYYHTGMRDVFVGSICAIALFLFFYKGYNKWENRSATLAGFFAIGIAWFPTTQAGPLDMAGIVHLICASAFFIILAGFSIFFFTMGTSHPTRQKLKRNLIYVVCGVVMIACLAAIIIFINFFLDDNPDSNFVFWAETIALIAFGVSWITKGGTLYPDK
jgi:hypothetical protein